MATQTYNSETVRVPKELLKEVFEAKLEYEKKTGMQASMTNFMSYVIRKGLKSNPQKG
jgi:hypothetical protein